MWSQYLLGNETKDSTTESKLLKSKTSLEMSRELHSSKTLLPVGKTSPLKNSGAAHPNNDAPCAWVRAPQGLFQDCNRVSSPMKFLPTPPLSVPSYCTPANHDFKSPISADAHEKGQCNKDWPSSSKPCTEAPQLQAHFRAPHSTSNKRQVTYLLIPSTAETHTQKSTDPDEVAIPFTWT